MLCRSCGNTTIGYGILVELKGYPIVATYICLFCHILRYLVKYRLIGKLYHGEL
jgi:hypothetical protein